jgi:hypothetical protein
MTPFSGDIYVIASFFGGVGERLPIFLCRFKACACSRMGWGLNGVFVIIVRFLVIGL